MRIAPVAAASLLAVTAAAAAEGPSATDRSRARAMLKTIKGELQKSYYDPGFHGLDLEARAKAAEEKIAAAGSLGQLMGIVAQYVLDLDDSHTRFRPPSTTLDVDYGWDIQMIGDRCVVVRVEKGSDAEAQGIKVGDVVLEAMGVTPTRENLWKFFYLYEELRPQPALTVVLQSPGQPPRKVQFKAEVRQAKRVLDLTFEGDSEDFWNLVRESEKRERKHYLQVLGGVVVWKMPWFFLERGFLERVVETARKGQALVIDMRGNGGGAIKVLEWVASGLFDREVKLADTKGRKKRDAIVARRQGTPFTGKLIVLVDSRSASAAEMLARVLQIERRGAVVGDRTAGAVMASRYYPLHLGMDRMVLYGLSITQWDVITTDGRSLEKVGVTPDVPLLPTPEDVAAGRDPVLARAVELAGGSLDPVAAGRLFPKDPD